MNIVVAFWLIFLALAVGLIFLQIFLSSRKQMWLGLVLPILSTISSILLAIIVGICLHSLQAYTPSGNETVSHQIFEYIQRMPILPIIITLLLSNVPTLFLFAVYAGYKEKKKAKLEMNKTEIQSSK